MQAQVHVSPQHRTSDTEDANLQLPVLAENTCTTSPTLSLIAGSTQPTTSRDTVLQSTAAVQPPYDLSVSKLEEAVTLVCTLLLPYYDLLCLPANLYCVAYT